MKAIIFDSSTLISFAMNGLLDYLRELKKVFDGKFLMTDEIKEEVIDKPMKINRFKLEGLMIKQLLDEKVLEMYGSLNINRNELNKETEDIMNIANSTLKDKNKNIHLIHNGESSCLALSKILTKKGIKNVISIDERTTRMLCEKPENLRKLMEKKLHTTLKANAENYSYFKGFRIIRSTELIYIAYKKKMIKLKNGGTILDAFLYALKTHGCSISDEEITEMKRMT
jgi:hypothetical protein